MSIRFECFGMTILKARAVDLEMHDFEGHSVEELTPVGSGGVLILYLPNDGTISLFMPYETALAYASAINTVNDREAVEKSDLEPSHEEQSMVRKGDTYFTKHQPTGE